MGDKRRRGGALIAVLWLVAGLAAIAFALATTVRGELEHTSTELDATRSYYLATGALERAMLYMDWGPRFQAPDGSSPFYSPWTSRLHFVFPTGEADVDVMPETSRLNINQANPEELLRLLAALGVEQERAVTIMLAILDWRGTPMNGGLTEFDRYYLSLNPSFLSRHASFRETEELLLLQGMTPDLYYGSFQHDARGQLRPVGGLADCVTVFSDLGALDVNTAPSPVLASVGLSPQAVAAIVQARREAPIRSLDPLRMMGLPDFALARLGLGGGKVFTLRATARLRLPDGRLSDAVRSAGATIRRGSSGPQAGFQVLRWRERLWKREAL